MAGTPPKTINPVQGEGDYASAKRFDDEEAAFVHSGKAAAAARAAEAALDGPEGDELEAARQASAKGKSSKSGQQSFASRRSPSASPT